MQNNKKSFKSGFVAIIGPPNVGKSTLLNKMLQQKLSITSKKPQTTRHRINGILNRENSQLIFIDTPGIHNTNATFNAKLVEIAVSVLEEADIILFVVDIAEDINKLEKNILKTIKKIKTKVIFVLNKIDSVKKTWIEDSLTTSKQKFDFEIVMLVSAKSGENVEELLEEIEKKLPLGPRFYPDDMLTDKSMRFIVEELVREKVFRFTGQEIPYSCAVTVDSFKEDNEKKITNIFATIHLEHESQKGIVIGKNGVKLKKIGTEARKDLEKHVDGKVFLKLFVRVQKNWSKDAKAMKKFGY